MSTLRGAGACIAAAVGLAFTGCATSTSNLPSNPATAPAAAAGNLSSTQIFTAQGAPTNLAQALGTMGGADYLLLGEVHDNPAHHRERAALLTALAERRPTVVFEQFSRSADAALATPAGVDLDAWVAHAGFDQKGWAWPLHKPLIQAALNARLPLRGGNLERDEARQIARQGAAAAPADLAPRLAVPLPRAASDALDRELLDGHCGQLPASALPRMRDAQAARDAAMADAMVRASSATGTPTVLIAGNGHVQRDHGVPLWLARLQPAARVVSVGFLERAADGSPPTPAELAVFDLVWVTPRQPRPDPCAGFSMQPKPASPPAIAPGLPARP